jgi:hypothetical protein
LDDYNKAIRLEYRLLIIQKSKCQKVSSDPNRIISIDPNDVYYYNRAINLGYRPINDNIVPAEEVKQKMKAIEFKDKEGNNFGVPLEKRDAIIHFLQEGCDYDKSAEIIKFKNKKGKSALVPIEDREKIIRLLQSGYDLDLDLD